MREILTDFDIAIWAAPRRHDIASHTHTIELASRIISRNGLISFSFSHVIINKRTTIASEYVHVHARPRTLESCKSCHTNINRILDFGRGVEWLRRRLGGAAAAGWAARAARSYEVALHPGQHHEHPQWEPDGTTYTTRAHDRRHDTTRHDKREQKATPDTSNRQATNNDRQKDAKTHSGTNEVNGVVGVSGNIHHAALPAHQCFWRCCLKASLSPEEGSAPMS